jgi:hypothetical protein
MTGSATAFDDDDLELLLALFDQPTISDDPRRPPWTWSVLHTDERIALGRMIDVWVDTFNHVHATDPTDLVPPCWRRHPGLATELAVQVWLWYTAHIHPQTTPLIAGDYYLRHLPGFRGRLGHLLGSSPPECRRGQHPSTWRIDTDRQLAAYTMTTTESADDDYVERLGELHFGFPTFKSAR